MRSAEDRITGEFFDRSVHSVARDLIGCTLLYRGRGGVIVETESYEQSDPACHAYVGLTPRTEVLFGPPGITYVYRSYGIHALLNFVCEQEGQAAAVLIRAIEPVYGIEEMRARRSGRPDHELCAGPGRLSQALGIDLDDNRLPVDRHPFELRHRGEEWLDPEVITGPRVGITKAVDLPWRFCAAGNRFVSRPRPPLPAVS